MHRDFIWLLRLRMKLLIVEDSLDTFQLISGFINSFWTGQFNIERVSGYSDGLTSVFRQEHDIYLIDEYLEGGSALDLLVELKSRGLRKPVIVLAEDDNRERDVRFMKAGASDYLVKRSIQPSILDRSIRYALQRAEFEDNLRVTTTRLHTLVNSLHSGILFESTDRRVLYVNKPFCTMLGIDLHPRDMLDMDCNKSFHGMDLLFSSGNDFIKTVRKMVDRGELVLGEELNLIDGRIFERDFIPIIIGNVKHGFLWHYRDITDRKKTEEKLEQKIRFENIISTISASFINMPLRDTRIFMVEALGSIGSYIRADRGYIYKFDDSLSRAECSLVWQREGDDVPKIKNTVFSNLSYPWWLHRITSHENIYIEDVDALPADAVQEKNFLNEVGIRGIAMLPMVIRGRIIGVLCFDYFTNDRSFDEEILGYLRIVSEIFSNTIERQQIEQALLKSEERYALVVRGASDGIWDWDLKKGEIYYSARWKNSLGYDEMAISSDPEEWFSRVHEDDIESLRTDVESHLNQETWFFQNEYRIRTGSGEYRWMLSRGIATFSKDGTAERMVGSQTDITDRKIAEEKLKQREQEQFVRLKQMEDELLMARNIQRQLLPKKMPRLERLTINAIYEPAELLGGDFYDFIIRDDNTIGVFLCDVSGHGVPSALIASMIKMSLEDIAYEESNPSLVLKRLNRVLHDKVGHYFLTSFYCVLDIGSMSMRCSCAGHGAAMMLRDGEIHEIKPAGGIIGPFPDQEYEEERIDLKKGDRIFIYTDGITECPDSTGGFGEHQLYGIERLENFIKENRDPGDILLRELVYELYRYQGSSVFEDDVTAVLLDL